ncbi:hypothetical protein BB778_04400 [Pluralibacter gergoviae]|uniref:hypothetical protein n=1 Tax=Pluralibacter gergoviae TaxID=61647 RepID=UPI0008DBF977|nr:hypothetical protein [Pluralibacter gergoviae]OHY61841.1 hypothetical protein BB778_04400 [Pluralibacter gergoviae]
MSRLFFSFKLWEATSSIRVMKMLAEQAEMNVSRAVSDSDLPGAVTEGEIVEDVEDEEGNWHTFPIPYFTCGSCSGYEAEEVKLQYQQLVSQLTRRSAFLTMFSLFEHRMVGCLDVMDKLSGVETKKTFKTVEDCHKRLTGTIGANDIMDVDHLTVIRNIMAHSDGVVENYHTLNKPNVKKNELQKRQTKALHRLIKANACISVTDFNNVLMDDGFLDYAVSEFERYVTEVDAAVRQYQKQHSRVSAGIRQRRGNHTVN